MYLKWTVMDLMDSRELRVHCDRNVTISFFYSFMCLIYDYYYYYIILYIIKKIEVVYTVETMEPWRVK